MPTALLRNQHLLAESFSKTSVNAVHGFQDAKGEMHVMGTLSVDAVRSAASFVHRDEATGQVSSFVQDITTLPNNVYLGYLPNVNSVSCQNDVMTITFNKWNPQHHLPHHLTFGTKRAHWFDGDTERKLGVSGGNKWMCKLGDYPLEHVHANTVAIESVNEDLETRRLTQIVLKVERTEPTAFFTGEVGADFNGSVTLLPHSMVYQATTGEFSMPTLDELEGRVGNWGPLASSGKCDYSFGGRWAYCAGSYDKTFSLFNFNYDTNTGQSSQYIDFISGSDVTGVKAGCVNCFAYAGITFEMGLEIGATLKGTVVGPSYAGLVITGTLAANFDFVFETGEGMNWFTERNIVQV